MKIEIIVSTLDNIFDNIDESIKKYKNVTIINQKSSSRNIDDKEVKNKKINNLNWIDINQIGLSKSRNYALDLATADYLYLTDDDIVLSPSFEEIVQETIKNNQKVDILAFKVGGIEKEFKKYPSRELNIGFLRSLKLSSVQLVICKDFIQKNKIKYDELFGAGAEYKMGEENIFLFDALKKGAKIKFIPKEIAKVHLNESSWFTGYDRKYFIDRGAIFHRMFGVFSGIYSMIFCVRKQKLYNKNFSIMKAYKYTQIGKKQYKKNKNS